MNKPKDFQLLVDAFKSLPNIGTKNATKYAYHLLKSDDFYINEFISRINKAKSNLNYCKKCHNLSNNEICEQCSVITPNVSLCIVASIEDLDKISSTHMFNGYYHILHGELDPKKNIDNKKIFIDDLISHIKEYEINEVLIATSFSISGELTSEYIKNILKDLNIKIYRIGFGIPMNIKINYADDQTLKFALLNKQKVN